MTTFAEIVEAADQLSMEEQEELVEIVKRRIAHQNRARLLQDVAEARAEYASGTLKPMTAAEAIRELQGDS